MQRSPKLVLTGNRQTNGSRKAFRSDQGRCPCLCGETATCKMDRQVLWLRKNQTPAHNQWLERVRHHWSSCKKDWFGPFFFIVMIIILIYHSFLKWKRINETWVLPNFVPSFLRFSVKNRIEKLNKVDVARK